jgi:hypothetical protein
MKIEAQQEKQELIAAKMMEEKIVGPVMDLLAAAAQPAVSGGYETAGK